MPSPLDNHPALRDAVESFSRRFADAPSEGLFYFAKVESLVQAAHLLERIIVTPDQDPVPPLTELFLFLAERLRRLADMADEFTLDAATGADLPTGSDKTRQLFEHAWTTYSDETYDHSVALVEDRLRQSGFDRGYFAGKVCFDGGCGTGRLALAMAKMGAKRVVAADFGGASLDFFRKQLDRSGLDTVEVVQADITDLSGMESDSFDFVASNGVLHHTDKCLEGLDEHYRITKPGGVLWLYLYGDGGFYWEIYDTLRTLTRDIDVPRFRDALVSCGVREGLVYTMLDNIFAPRTYHFASDIVARLNAQHPATWTWQDGASVFDNPPRYTATRFGKTILGPEGEVRIVVRKD
jgi:ubiquinone/menaquinone biosynthesis C-methylase UbiE